MPNAAEASGAARVGLCAISVTTTNCNPISAPAAEPTMTVKAVPGGELRDVSAPQNVEESNKRPLLHLRRPSGGKPRRAPG